MAEALIDMSDVKSILAVRRNQTVLAAMVAAFLSLAASTEHDYWIVFAVSLLVSFYLITRAFERSWGYIFWLGFIYLLSFVGLVSLLVLSEDGGHFVLTGLLVEGFAVFVIYIYIRRVKDRRDIGDRSQYMPLGLWALSLLAFLFISNVSVLAWIAWAQYRAHIVIYLAAESLLILLVFFILWIPDEMESRMRRIEETIAQGGKRSTNEKCPACGAALDLEVRLCPECGTPGDFMWCPDSEEYIERCPKCGELITLGSKNCQHCGAALQRDVICPKCKKRSAISKWKAIRSS